MSILYKIFNDSGLTALTNYIKTTRAKAVSNEAAIGGLGEDLAGLSGEVVTALDNKQNKLTFDTTPTAGSTNPVTSGGIYSGLSEKASINHEHTAENVTFDDGETIQQKYNNGTLSSDKFDVLPIERGGTNANSINVARDNLDAQQNIVKVEILETICENITFTDDTPSHTFDTAIEIESGALYYLAYDYYDASGNYDVDNSGYCISKPVDSVVRWLTNSEYNSVTMNNSSITDTWRGSEETSKISIYKISLNINKMIARSLMESNGFDITASGACSHAEGWSSTASGMISHAEGWSSTASGDHSHAEGSNSTASGDYSHAEGSNSTASGMGSHAEGIHTTAKGFYSHAEGYGSSAEYSCSHAEGLDSIVKGNYSHAEGESSHALSNHQHVQGKYNVGDSSGKYAHIVGNGASDTNRSNAHTLDWNGNAWFAGDLYVKGTSQDDAAAVKLATLNDIPDPGLQVVTTAGTGAAYTATVSGIDPLTTGASFIMIPNVVSTSVSPTLDVNEFGPKIIRRPISTNTTTTVAASDASWLAAGKPIMVTYNGTYWVADLTRPYATDLYGTVPVANGGVPSCTTSDNGKFLRVVDGVASWATISSAEEASF